MKAETYIKQLQKRAALIEKQWNIMKELTNNFKAKNPLMTTESFLNFDDGYKVEAIADSLVDHGAWIYDRLNGINTTLDKLSVTGKLRNVLGYNPNISSKI